MSDQSYADSGGVQIFHAGTPNDILVPEADLTATGSPSGTVLATLLAGTSRYTVTSVGVAVTSTITGSRGLTVEVQVAGTGTANSLGLLNLNSGDVQLLTGDVVRVNVSIDLLPGQALVVKAGNGTATAGTGAILFEGYSSQFAGTSSEDPIDIRPPASGNPSMLYNSPANTSVDPVVRSAPLIGQSE